MKAQLLPRRSRSPAGFPIYTVVHDMTDQDPSPESIRQWLAQRPDASEFRNLALEAVDAFELVIASATPCVEAMDKLGCAAMHSEFVIWDVGLLLLSHLGESQSDARSRIAELAHSRKMEHRRRSIQYISDRYPSSFCRSLLSELLCDRSAKIRGFSASRIERLNLREMIPTLEVALQQESHAGARFEIEFSLALLRDNYFEYENTNGYTMVLRCDQLFPPVHHWPSHIAGERVSRDTVGRHGIPVAIEEMRQSSVIQAVNATRRPWHVEESANSEN